jgi:hypothetical protein
MVTPQTRLRLNAGKVVASLVDGAPVMINLSSGVYYSMDGTAGGFIWERIVASHSIEEIAAALAEQYEVSMDRAREDVTALAAKLLAEEVVAAEENGTAASGAIAAAPAERLPYAPPNLDIYRDIGHLCALDPPMPGLKDLQWKGPGGESSS